MYFIFCFVLSFGLGLIFRDQYFLGSLSMFLACIQTYYMAKGKWFEEFVGLINTFVSMAICILSGMFATAIFSVFIYIPLSIFTMINWKKHNKNDEVELREMSLFSTFVVFVLIVVLTALISYLLSLIPSQNLALLDTAGDVLNISGIVLLALRFKEGWLVWFMGSSVDLAVWIMALKEGYSSNAIMMIILSFAYFILNLWGYYSFIKLHKKQEGLEKISA